MLRFDSDYMEGAHPQILKRLYGENSIKHSGYGEDELCESARAKIRAACGAPEADVYFISGGTQTNAVALRSMLRPYEGVISADTGHISCHEAGAIEYGGHKVITLPHKNGKLAANDVREYLIKFYADATWPHMVRPGAVYISHPTEYGTLYTKAELTALSGVCAEYRIPLYLDGARLACGLAARGTDVTLRDIAALCSAFYIGGTKCGALFGEALVFPHGCGGGMFTIIKQSGALFAKGWLLGLQFDELFTDGLYLSGGKNAVAMAEKLKAGLLAKGYKLFIDSPTNQQFVVLDDKKLDTLKKDVSFSFWEKYDETHTVVRFATSWATTEEDMDKLIALM